MGRGGVEREEEGARDRRRLRLRRDSAGVWAAPGGGESGGSGLGLVLVVSGRRTAGVEQALGCRAPLSRLFDGRCYSRVQS